ncbi:MAG: hypothetical protein LBT38_10305, partial [Deltaproteobacteria bacterium]|nr:hypothetical protein [Deltaproteobacteria bacterium]
MNILNSLNGKNSSFSNWRKEIAAIFLALIASLWAWPLSAQTAEEIWRLEPITVTSTRVARELSEIPLSVSVVDE